MLPHASGCLNLKQMGNKKEKIVMPSYNNFKIGQTVTLKHDFGIYLMVAKYNGKKCLKIATCTGWRYFEPENWEDVIHF